MRVEVVGLALVGTGHAGSLRRCNVARVVGAIDRTQGRAR